ncbi:unnamed protein product [Mucor hiemalis]
MYEKAAKEFNHTESQFCLADMYEQGSGVEVDFEQAVVWYKQASQKGHNGAQNNLGYLYYNGSGVEVSYEEALRYFKMSANQGSMDAQYNLGLMYQKGQGVPINHKESVQWFQNARCEKYHIWVDHKLGCAYQNGLGVDRDIKKALRYFRFSALGECDLAQLQLGIHYMNGFGVDKDYREAISWLKKSENLSASRLCLGFLYENGFGVDQDKNKASNYYDDSSNSYGNQDVAMYDLGMIYLKLVQKEKFTEQALYWLKKVAEKDNVHALIAIGSMYLSGLFNDKRDTTSAYAYLSRAAKLEQTSLDLDQLKPPRDLKSEKKYSNAMKWYTKTLDNGLTIEEGCVSGLSCLGFMYYEGLGVQQDFVKAHEIYLNVLQEVDDDDTDANLCLGLLYSKGLGVKRDYKKAIEYFERSAKAVNTYAYNLIGDAYRLGRGVKEDPIKAIEWYKKGSKYNDGYSQLNIGKLYLGTLGFSAGAITALEWFRKSYNNSCKESMEFIKNFNNDNFPTTEQLLAAEHVAREGSEENLQELMTELARIDPKNAYLSNIITSKPIVPSTHTTLEAKSVYQFFHLDQDLLRPNE